MNRGTAPANTDLDPSLEVVLESMGALKRARVAAIMADLPAAERRRAPMAQLAYALKRQSEERSTAALQKRISAAHLSNPNADLHRYYDEMGRGVRRANLDHLAKGGWITDGHNLIITGPVHSGKSYLASALCTAAMVKGKTVLCFQVADLLADWHLKHLDGTLPALRQAINRVDLFMLDGWGITRITTEEVDILACALDHRISHGKSILVSSVLPISEWRVWCQNTDLGESLALKLSRVAEHLDLVGRAPTAAQVSKRFGSDK